MPRRFQSEGPRVEEVDVLQALHVVLPAHAKVVRMSPANADRICNRKVETILKTSVPPGYKTMELQFVSPSGTVVVRGVAGLQENEFFLEAL